MRSTDGMDSGLGGEVGRQDSPSHDRPVGYEPPRLVSLGALAQLTRGVTGESDGLGPGSALG
ncbi:MAG: lasso RiPP family leader peptide-containing protein [Solirubrobacteraceae bacterium]